MSGVQPKDMSSDTVDADAITLRNQTASPLLRLPRELRDMIWAFALSGHYISHKYEYVHGPEDRVVYFNNTNQNHARAHARARDIQHLLALPSTCRQTYAESRDIIFNSNEFGSCTIAQAKKLVEKLASHQRALIRKFRFKPCHLSCFDLDETALFLDKLPGLEDVTVMADCANGSWFVATIKEIVGKAGRPVRVEHAHKQRVSLSRLQRG